MLHVSPHYYYLKKTGRKHKNKTGGSSQTESASNSIVDIVEFKNGWYNNFENGDAKDDDRVLEEYRQFKHNNHTSWLFDIDTMHDTINPHKMPVDKINDFLVKGDNQNDIPSVNTIRKKIKTAKILNRNDIDTLDDKYTIVKDYGPGSHLLTLDCLIDSASTPSIKKFLKKKGDFFNIKERGSCIDNGNDRPKPRTFDLTQPLDSISCVDNNSSISGVDISLYQYLYDKYHNFFPKPDDTSSQLKNLILLNYIWQLNLYYCISKCVAPKPEYKYSKALLTLNRLAFTGFEKTAGSFVPKFSYQGDQLQDFELPKTLSGLSAIIEKIQNTFLNKLKQNRYVLEDDIIQFKIQIKDLTKKDKKEEEKEEARRRRLGPAARLAAEEEELTKKKQFVFNISQAEVAKHIINILQKHNLKDNDNAYNAANIISRNDGENVKDKDKTIKVLTNYYFKFFGENKTDDQTYVQYIFMLRLLKFMGDRSHIVMAKLVEKASGENDDILSPILYTGERPLQVSSINEGLNTVMQYVSVHKQLGSGAQSKDFLFCNSGLKPKEFSKLVCSKIISAFCWYYVQTYGNEPSDNYTIINTITSTSISTSTSTSHSISLKITFNKDNIVYIDFDNEISHIGSIQFFTGDDQKKALSSLENVSFDKVVYNNTVAFVQNGGDLTSQISIEGNVPIILKNFFRDITTNDIDNNKNLWQDYKVINNIEFGDMFTEFYGNTIKKLSGKKHLLELRRWIFQMLSINDKRPRGNISMTENVNNPKAAFFYFLCTSEEFGQGRSTLLILNTLEKALKQLETLYNKKQETDLNPLLKQKAKNAYEALCFKLSGIKPVVDLFHAVNLKVNLGDPETEIKDKIKCDIDDERNFNVISDDNLNNKLALSDYLFNTGFKDVLNTIPNNDNSSRMTFRKITGEWNKYCCNPILLENNGIPEGNDNTNYMTRNPIYENESEQQKNNNNCVVNHDSRLNIYNKLLDIRKLFYTSQLFKTDSAKEEIENIQKETIVEEVCLDTMGNNSELIQEVLSDRTTSESSEFVLSSDTKTKIDLNYKNLFDKISENYDYYKSDDITLVQRKNHLIELGKRFFRKGYEIYNYCISGVEQMDTSTEGGNLSMVGGASGDPLKEIEWRTIKNHFLFNCIVEYLINIHFEKYFLEYHKRFATITEDYIQYSIHLSRGFYNSSGYDSKEYVDHFDEFLNEKSRIMMENRREASAFGDVPQEYIDYEIQTPIPPIPKLSDLNMYMDLFDSPIYSFPITKDFSKNAFQSPTSSPNKKTPAAPVTQSPEPVHVPRDVYEAQKREAERVKAALEGRDMQTEDVGLPSSEEDDESLARELAAERTYRRRGQRWYLGLEGRVARRLGFDEELPQTSDFDEELPDDLSDEELPDAPPRQASDLEEGEIAEGSRRG